MGLSRQEVNLRRLLAKCEILIKSNRKTDTRFPLYLSSLEEMILEIKSQSTPNENVLDYVKRINSLKFQLGILDEELASGDADNETLNSREELLDVRKRNVGKSEASGDLNQMLTFHQNMHEKIAEEMLELTSSLKNHSALANRIIKKDTEVIGRSSQMTDQNFSKLKVESDKLTEHSKRAWKCWLWVLLLIVMVVFINMVLFMKVMKKK